MMRFGDVVQGLGQLLTTLSSLRLLGGLIPTPARVGMGLC